MHETSSVIIFVPVLAHDAVLVQSLAILAGGPLPLDSRQDVVNALPILDVQCLKSELWLPGM